MKCELCSKDFYNDDGDYHQYMVSDGVDEYSYNKEVLYSDEQSIYDITLCYHCCLVDTQLCYNIKIPKHISKEQYKQWMILHLKNEKEKRTK